MDKRERIIRRVAQELRDGDYVNLGIGMPTMVANFVPPGIDITLHSENGMLFDCLHVIATQTKTPTAAARAKSFMAAQYNSA